MNSEHPERLNLLKAQELRRLRKLKGWKQHELALLVRVTRETVSNWETGQWPDNALVEIGLATLFEKPPTHFHDAAQAVMTHEARTAHPETAGEIPMPIAQLHHLFSLDPRHSSGPWTMQEVQDHLARQIDFFFRQAMPDGQVTLEGMKRARALLTPKRRTKDKK